MTQEEYTKSFDGIKNEISNLEHEIFVKRQELDKLILSYCEDLKVKYAQYINKKVKITFDVCRSYWLKENTDEYSVEGFLEGFVRSNYSTDIYPRVAQIKKDGSKSLRYYPFGDVYHFETIKSIEIIGK